MGAGAQDDDGVRGLAPFGGGDADYANLGDVGVAGHDALDLGWVHVLAAGNAPRVRIGGSATASTDPVIMLTAGQTVVEKVLARAGLQPGDVDVDVFEFAEAFAALCLRFRRDLDAGPERMTPNGGTIAMAHAFGATGAILLCCVADELERRVMTDRALAGAGGGRVRRRPGARAVVLPGAGSL